MSGEPFPEEDGMPDEEWLPPEDAAAAPAGVDAKTSELTDDAAGLEVIPDLLDRMAAFQPVTSIVQIKASDL